MQNGKLTATGARHYALSLQNVVADPPTLVTLELRSMGLQDLGALAKRLRIDDNVTWSSAAQVREGGSPSQGVSARLRVCRNCLHV